MGSSEKLQNEVLLKEEAFLKDEKAKLTDQLNRLKVEERALLKLLSSSDENQHQKTMQLFNKHPQVAEPPSSTQRMSNFEVEIEVNRIPLQGLNTNQLMQVDGEEEEDEDIDDDTEDEEADYSRHLMNAVSNLHSQDPMDQGMPRSMLQSILQQEVGDLEEDDNDFW